MLTGYFLNLSVQNLQTDILLHFATLIAIVVFFYYKWVPLLIGAVKLKKESWLYILYIVSGTIPATIIGFLLKDKVEYTFENPLIASLGLLFTGIILIGGGLLKKEKEKRLNLLTAIVIGMTQAIAILPGISRSGITVMAGILMGLSFRDSFEFSFLLSIPIILGGVILNFLDNGFVYDPYTMKGATLALFFAFVSLFIFRKLLKKNKLYLFGIYCILISLIVLTILIF